MEARRNRLLLVKIEAPGIPLSRYADYIWVYAGLLH
jgi:hypothetical protein